MSDEGSVGANLKPSSLHCRTVELDPASPRFFDAREDPASPPPEAAIAELLLQAEQLWLKGKRDGSLALYDRAIGVAAAAGDTDKEVRLITARVSHALRQNSLHPRCVAAYTLLRIRARWRSSSEGGLRCYN